MDKEKLISQFNEGRSAAFLLNELSPYIEELRTGTLNRMKAVFRSGDVDKTLAINVASLCVLDDLMDLIKNKFKRGENAAKKLGEET